MFASPEDSNLSVSSLSQTSKNFFNSLELRRNQNKHVSQYKPHSGNSFSSNSSSDSDSFNRKSSKEESNLIVKGIKRSTAFHTAELLQQQVILF